MFTQSIFKSINAAEDFEERINSGEVDLNALHRFMFTIPENSLNYLGTWHFDNPIVSFTDDKAVYNPDFKPLEFEVFRKQAGLNSLVMTPKPWIQQTNAIGIVSKTGKYGGGK